MLSALMSCSAYERLEMAFVMSGCIRNCEKVASVLRLALCCQKLEALAVSCGGIVHDHPPRSQG